MNFNDFASGMVFLFQLLIANNWKVFMDAVVDVSGADVGGWARLYCMSYWVLAVTFVPLAVLACPERNALRVVGSAWRFAVRWLSYARGLVARPLPLACAPSAPLCR